MMNKAWFNDLQDIEVTCFFLFNTSQTPEDCKYKTCINKKTCHPFHCNRWFIDVCRDSHNWLQRSRYAEWSESTSVQSEPWFSTSQRVQRTWTSDHGGSHTVEDRFSVTVEIGISETTSTAHSFRYDRRAVLSTFNIEKCRTLRQKQLMCGAYMINLSFLPTSTKHVVHPQNLEALPTSQH